MNVFVSKLIDIDVKGRKLRIGAFVLGDLAFHTGQGSCWVMTHIPSGQALATQLPDPKTARALIRKCLASGIDWSNPDPSVYAEQVRAKPTLYKAIARYRDA